VNDIDALLEKFQQEMLNDARETYGDIFFSRWQNPLYMGTLDDADAAACLKGGCGDTMMIFLKFENGRVKAASFQTDGCAPSIVCGSVAAELALGKNPEALLDISASNIIAQLGYLPEAIQHCAYLAAATVHHAVDRYMADQIAQRGAKMP
jgi:nitrogen fixation NifU-like protein